MRESRKSPKKKGSPGKRASAGEPPEPPPQRRGWVGPAGADALALARGALGRAGFEDPSLVLRWTEIAGEGVARVAEPVKFQEGPEGAVLTLRCEPSAAVFLQHETRALLGRLNAYLGQGRIARLRLMPGEVSAPARKARPESLSRAFPATKPENLSEALERLARLRRH